MLHSNLVRSSLFSVCLLIALAAGANGAIMTVTTTGDTDDGVCDAHCSLREAVARAIDGDTIVFDRALRGSTIQLTNTLLIGKTLTIDGPNRRRITIRGNNAFRILHVSGGSVQARVSIDGLIIRDGAQPGGLGGGIYLDTFDTLFLTDCLITNNHAAVGGGIRSFLGFLFMKDCTIANNTSDGPGGGAGIEARLDGGYVEIVNSTITGNVAADGTGGIKLTVRESMNLISSTVVDNHSSGMGEGRVGGVYTTGPSGGGGIYNTIIARNTGQIPDLRLGSGFHNFIGNGFGSFCESGFCTESIVGTPENPIDPRLGPLTDNGNGLPSFALLASSRAINAGHNQGGPGEFPDFSTDQRGFARIANKIIDMGAVEYGSTPVSKPYAILGRVITATGRGVSGARVTLTGGLGLTRIVVANSAGYYRFNGVTRDETVAIQVQGKRFRSIPQTLLVEEEREYVDFVVD